MKNHNLETKYNHLKVEDGRYEKWLGKNLFQAKPNEDKSRFSIILPPPNVTGKLHLGHAWDGSLQDALIRFKKLRGFDVLYLPGMDHAGIATQAKVEAKLRESNINRFDLGREKFLDEVWKWKDEYALNIRQQWAKLGLSLDYSMENFTLNPEVNNLVNEVFVDFYNKGLIYKDKKIVNWDPKQKTAISNIEVIYKETKGFMYYFKYMIEGSSEFLSVATTRPETMFGDVCVVVNPKDERYKQFIGKTVINPANGQSIPVIADEYVEIDFGTGVMKCTPAHDPNDFEIGKRHNLEKIICMNEDGTINDVAGIKYQGLDRFEARNKLIRIASENDLFIKSEEIIHQVGYSERSDAIVEPYLSNQWFVKMRPLAEKILKLQKSNNAINFFPKRFEQVLERWMNDIHDWTISRQLWWGHQIPAWYNIKDNSIYVGLEAPKDLENWKRDEDVLDTWFSSGLWPFATLYKDGDKNSIYFKEYFPTSTLVTGYDIIFFWVARMIFQGLENVNEKPFNDVLIHGLVRDEQGRKMSKSLGNGIDPMDVIENYGTDSLRFFLLTNSTPGQDIKYSEEKIKSSWNFINKLWNASRYVLMNLEEFEEDKDFIKKISLSNNKSMDVNKWIISELTNIKIETAKLIDKYEFAIAGKMIYDFVWSKYCSWFIEFAKVNLNSNDLEAQELTKQTLFYVLKNILIILHPFSPFITEEIYEKLNLKDSIMNETWDEEENTFNTNYINEITEIISVIREFRNKNNIKNSTELSFSLSNLNEEKESLFNEYLEEINKFLVSFVNAKIITNKTSDDATSISVFDYFLEIENAQFIDLSQLIKELEDKKTTLENEILRSEKMLNNENFIAKANEEKILEEKNKYQSYKEQLEAIKNKLNNIK